MEDEQIAAVTPEAPKSSSQNVVDTGAMATSPGITDTLAALTLSTSSEGKSNSFTLPDMGERLKQWLEDELLGSSNVCCAFEPALGNLREAETQPCDYRVFRDTAPSHSHLYVFHARVQPTKRSKSGEDQGSVGGPSDGENRLYIKLLVSNAASGSIIGKMGVNIHHTQTTTGAKIQLSKPAQVFPGTNDRTLLIRGNLCQLASAVYSIFIRLIEEDCAPTWSHAVRDDDDGGAATVGREKVTPRSSTPSAPSTSSGDSDVSDASEASEIVAKSSPCIAPVSTPEREESGVAERKASDQRVESGETGSVEEECHDTVDEKNDQDTIREGSLETNATAARGKPNMDLSEAVAKTQLQVKLLIPESFIGYIVGRRGENVMNICDTTHTSIKVFPQPHGVNCLTHQAVSIRGHLVDIIKAISMIVVKQADDRDFFEFANIPYTYLRASFGAPLVMPVYHPQHPEMVGMGGQEGTSRGSHARDAPPGPMPGPIPNIMPGHTYPYVDPMGASQAHSVCPTSLGGPMVSLMVPLLPEHQSEILKNMGGIAQSIQVNTGVFLKLESIPGQSGFCARLDGPRDYVMMAMNFLHSQLSFASTVGNRSPSGMHPVPGLPMRSPKSHGMLSPLDDRPNKRQTQ